MPPAKLRARCRGRAGGEEEKAKPAHASRVPRYPMEDCAAAHKLFLLDASAHASKAPRLSRTR